MWRVRMMWMVRVVVVRKVAMGKVPMRRMEMTSATATATSTTSTTSSLQATPWLVPMHHNASAMHDASRRRLAARVAAQTCRRGLQPAGSSVTDARRTGWGSPRSCAAADLRFLRPEGDERPQLNAGRRSPGRPARFSRGRLLSAYAHIDSFTQAFNQLSNGTQRTNDKLYAFVILPSSNSSAVVSNNAFTSALATPGFQAADLIASIDAGPLVDKLVAVARTASSAAAPAPSGTNKAPEGTQQAEQLQQTSAADVGTWSGLLALLFVLLLVLLAMAGVLVAAAYRRRSAPLSQLARGAALPRLGESLVDAHSGNDQQQQQQQQQREEELQEEAREQRPVYRSGEGLLYVLTILTSTLLLLLGVMASLSTPSDVACSASTWLWHLGASGCLASLLAKLLYVVRLEHDRSLLELPPERSELLLALSCNGGVHTLLLAIRAAAFPFVRLESEGWICATDDAVTVLMQIILWCELIAVLLLALYARVLDVGHCDTRAIFRASLVVVICLLFTLPPSTCTSGHGLVVARLCTGWVSSTVALSIVAASYLLLAHMLPPAAASSRPSCLRHPSPPPRA